MKQRSLRRRIAITFLGLALFAGIFGGFLAVLFAYTTEDHIFGRLLDLEVERLRGGVPGQPLPEPVLPFATYYRDGELPSVLSAPLELEPERREIFVDDGRHYHLRSVHPGGSDTLWVVLQVEDYLAVRPALSGIMVVLALSVLAIILVAAAAGLYLAHRVTRPLRSLTEEVTSVKPHALPTDWSARYPADEVGQLADTLRDAFRRIEDFVEREQRFTQDASHELRTPLAVIESSVELLSGEPDRQQAAALVDRIGSAALSMHLSVDVLLALAREDDPARCKERVAVLPVVERIVVNHAALLEGKPVELKVALDPHWRITGDPAALQVLVANLISNAFRYTRRGEIRIEREGDDLLVIDSGDGIDEKLRPDVTSPSVKGSASLGLGLGLSIVDRLCQRYGWRFTLDSSHRGTTARLSLG